MREATRYPLDPGFGFRPPLGAGLPERLLIRQQTIIKELKQVSQEGEYQLEDPRLK